MLPRWPGGRDPDGIEIVTQPMPTLDLRVRRTIHDGPVVGWLERITGLAKTQNPWGDDPPQTALSEPAVRMLALGYMLGLLQGGHLLPSGATELAHALSGELGIPEGQLDALQELARERSRTGQPRRSTRASAVSR
jgi:hypothetical protein